MSDAGLSLCKPAPSLLNGLRLGLTPSFVRAMIRNLDRTVPLHWRGRRAKVGSLPLANRESGRSVDTGSANRFEFFNRREVHQCRFGANLFVIHLVSPLPSPKLGKV